MNKKILLTVLLTFLSVQVLFSVYGNGFLQGAFSSGGGDSATIVEDSSKAIGLRGSAPYTVTTNPTHGSLTLNANTATYTPNSNYNGADGFTYTNGAGSSIAVTLNVTAANDAPTANAVSTTGPNDRATLINFDATDVDGDSLTYSVVNGPAIGSLSTVTGNTANYTPPERYVGAVNFNYSVTDGKLTSSGTVTFTVTDAPHANEVSVAVVEGGSVNIVPSMSDADSTGLTLSTWSSPTHGTLTKTSKGWTYTPSTGFVGVDSFTYQATDGTIQSSDGLIRINVTPSTGVPGTPIAQIGVNFFNLMNDDNTAANEILPTLVDLGVQVVRQVGSGDTGWSNVELRDGYSRNPENVAIARKSFHDAGIEVINTLDLIMFASATPPWEDYTDPAEADTVVTPEFIDYVNRVIADIHAITPAGATVFFEPGNELFHWVAYPEIDFTAEKQAVVFGYETKAVKEGLEALGHKVVAIAPSIMIDSTLTWDWWNAFMGTMDSSTVDGSSSDFIYENYHDYASEENFLENRDTYEEAGMWELPKLHILTEFGFSDDPTTDHTTNNTWVTKTQRLAKRMVMAWGAGDTAAIYHTFWNAYESSNDLRGTGLINESDGSWTPAAHTYKLISDELIPFTQVADLSIPANDLYLYEFRSAGGKAKYVVWGSGNFTVPARVTQSINMMDANGNFTVESVLGGQTIVLGDTPLLLK